MGCPLFSPNLFRFVESFSKILDQALTDYFEIFKIDDEEEVSIQKAKEIMAKLYNLINAEWIVDDFNKATFFEKRVYNDIKVYLDDKNPKKIGRF